VIRYLLTPPRIAAGVERLAALEGLGRTLRPQGGAEERRSGKPGALGLPVSFRPQRLDKHVQRVPRARHRHVEEAEAFLDFLRLAPCVHSRQGTGEAENILRG